MVITFCLVIPFPVFLTSLKNICNNKKFNDFRKREALYAPLFWTSVKRCRHGKPKSIGRFCDCKKRSYNFWRPAQQFRHPNINRWLTNNPKKIIGLKGYNLEITEWVRIGVCPNENNHRYLTTKRVKLEHIFTKSQNVLFLNFSFW